MSESLIDKLRRDLFNAVVELNEGCIFNRSFLSGRKYALKSESRKIIITESFYFNLGQHDVAKIGLDEGPQLDKNQLTGLVFPGYHAKTIATCLHVFSHEHPEIDSKEIASSFKYL